MPLDKPTPGKRSGKGQGDPQQIALRFCVFGDSHIACIKHALDEGLLDLQGIELEFWGAPGPQFRDLHFVDGQLVGTTEAARDNLAKINPARSAALVPQDFDGFLFIGCRLRLSELLVPLLQNQAGKPGYVSAAVRDLMLTRWLEGCRWYRAAREFAKERPVYFSPAGFLNEGVLSEDELASAINAEATAAERSALWQLMEVAMAGDAIQLLRQPEETVTRGALTARSYATTLGVQDDDAVHKNGAYGALILNQALAQLRSSQKTA
jgi:hypothetical protein